MTLYPNLWDEDSLMFGDEAEREMLLQQFHEIFGIAQDPSKELTANTNNSNITCHDHLLTKTTKDYLLDCSSLDTSILHSSPAEELGEQTPLHVQEPTSIELASKARINNDSERSRTNNDSGSFSSIAGTPEITGTPPSKSSLLDNNPFRDGSTNHHLPSPGILPPVPPNHKFVAIVKLADGNLYMATTDSPSGRETTGPALSASVTPSHGQSSFTERYFQDPGKSQPQNAGLVSGSPCSRRGEGGRLTPKRLFPTEEVHSVTSVPRKSTRTHVHLEGDLSSITGDSGCAVTQDILNDLAVIRTHRRSSYADGDSLVEVQPACLPGSPTMFAYRDPQGGIRVPLNMQCNQQALAAYRNITPTKRNLDSDKLFDGVSALYDPHISKNADAFSGTIWNKGQSAKNDIFSSISSTPKTDSVFDALHDHDTAPDPDVFLDKVWNHINEVQTAKNENSPCTSSTPKNPTLIAPNHGEPAKPETNNLKEPDTTRMIIDEWERLRHII